MTRDLTKPGPTEDVAAHGRKRKDEQLRAQLEKTDIQAVLSTGPGRRLLGRVIAMGHIDTAILPGPMSDFKEGERNLALKIKAMLLRADPQNVVAMQMDRLNDEAKKEMSDG
jgi:hypothetical protein